MTLSVREKRVLVELMDGDGAEAVGERLGISVQTVKNHLNSAYHKLEVSSLVAAYRRLGWLAKGDAVKKTTNAEARRKALLEARASVRADILLEPDMTSAQILERVTRSIDRLIERTK